MVFLKKWKANKKNPAHMKNAHCAGENCVTFCKTQCFRQFLTNQLFELLAFLFPASHRRYLPCKII